MKRSVLLRLAAGSAGAVLMLGVAGAAFADTEVDDGDVDVNVEIEEFPEPGVLAMTVAGTSTNLTETGTLPTVREFTGTLPTVTVTDTRIFPDRLPPGAAWYVLGSSTDFVGDASQPNIPAGNLGWVPTLAPGTDVGEVSAGEQVDTVLDTGPDAVGLVDQELLIGAVDSAGINPTGSWSVNAALFLKTPITVAEGSYTAKLTLSLFE